MEDDPELPMQHINSIPLSMLELTWRRAGLGCTDMAVSRYRRWAKLLWPFVYPLQWLTLRSRLIKRVKDPTARARNRSVYDLLMDNRTIMGRIVVFQLQKPEHV